MYLIGAAFGWGGCFSIPPPLIFYVSVPLLRIQEELLFSQV